MLLVLGVKLTSLLNKTCQSYGIRFEGAFFRKIENSPIKEMLTPAMVVANSTSTHAGIWSVNDRWSGLIVQVRTKLCGHLNRVLE